MGCSVIEEILPNPGVDPGQSDFVAIGGDRHTDERGIGIGRFGCTLAIVDWRSFRDAIGVLNSYTITILLCLGGGSAGGDDRKCGSFHT